MAVDNNDLQTLKFHLRDSVSILSDLKLHQGAKWCAEALNGMMDEDNDSILDSDAEDLTPTPGDIPRHQLKIKLKELDKFALAKSYFDCKEFDRCSHVLKNCTSLDLIFLKLYSSYLVGEKRREEESEGVLGENDSHSVNKTIPSILKELESLSNHDNPFLNYLYGIVLTKQNSLPQAKEAFLNSIKKYPFNWGCWNELIQIIPTLDEALTIIELLKFSFRGQFSESIILSIAKITWLQEFFQQSEEMYTELDQLISIFPQFSFLKTQKALISYHALDYQEAEKLFDDVLQNDPLRLDDIDVYSNILYVMQKRQKLSYLARFACSIDKFRPETCCIVANYYSLKYEHEKAIMYYRRALTLNRSCLSAWTLMGHEFVELKNTHAAIESYRRAVDTNSKDFKAWYGLGQAYEVLDMHLYSLYYYQKACSLKPLDKRIWQALGNCFEKLQRYNDSVKCYEKVMRLNDDSRDVVILFNIATLYEKMQEYEKTNQYMKYIYDEEISENLKNDETAKARLWLARFSKSRGDWDLALRYSEDMTYGTGQEIEEARSIAREAKSHLNPRLVG